MNDVVLAVDLGGTNLRMAAVRQDGHILHLAKTPTPREFSPDLLMQLFEKLASECRAAIGSDHAIGAIGAGVPANVNTDGILRNLPNLPLLAGMHLKTELTSKFGLPAVVENDATAAAIGENWLGASMNVRDSVLITLGTGVGGGIIINNEPLRGVDGTAGKIGHMCVEPDGAPCGCGSRGCIEQYASATAMVRMAREAGLELSTSRELYDASMSGDEKARSVFQKMGTYLGITIGALLNALNPEMVVIGGGAAAGWDAFVEPLNSEIQYRAFSEPAARAEIVRSQLGDNAGILGSARSALAAISH
jgi:glucokinase